MILLITEWLVRNVMVEKEVKPYQGNVRQKGIGMLPNVDIKTKKPTLTGRRDGSKVNGSAFLAPDDMLCTRRRKRQIGRTILPLSFQNTSLSSKVRHFVPH